MTGRSELAVRWLDDVFTHAPAAMALLRGPDHVIEPANPAYVAIAGGRDCIGRPIADVLPEADAYIELLDRVRSTGVAQRAEEAPLRLEGEADEQFIDFVYHPLLDDSRNVDAIVVVAVDVTARVRNRQRAERSLAVLGGQREVLERIVAGEPLPVVLDTLVRMVEDWSGDGVLGSVLLLDDDGVHLRHGAAPHLPDSYNEAIDGVAIGPAVGSCGTAAYRREQVIVSDIAVDPLWADFREVAAEAGLRACWSTPILAEGEVLGTFAMYYREPRSPAIGDLALIDVLVRTAAIAIARARADEERERALADLQFVLDVTTQVASNFDDRDTLGLLAQLAVPTLGDICLVDVSDGGTIRRVAAAAHRPEHQRVVADLVRFPPDPSGFHPAAAVLASGEPQHSAEVTDDFLRSTCRDEEHLEAVRRLRFESYLSLPLTARGTALGALTLVSAGSGRRYGPRDLSVAQDLAGRVALAIDNARLYRTARDAEQQLSLVARVGVALTSSLDLETVLDRLGSLLLGEVGDRCEIHLRDLDGAWWRRTFDDDASTTRAGALPAPVLKALEAGGAIHVDARDAHSVFAGDVAAGTFESAIVVPLLARGDTLGAIALAVRAGTAGARVEPDIVSVLAGRAALAIDNARMFEVQRTAAETLQRSLLPRSLPAIAGVKAAARYQPGGPRSEVGGDWYDLVPVDGGKLAVAMGDVMGRGIEAAAVMGQLRNALRALLVEGRSPADALGLLNRLLTADEQAALATLFVAVVDPMSRSITAANAGHCPPLVLAGGDAAYLDVATHPPLGVPFEGGYAETASTLPAGAVIVLYTDGLIERRDRPLADGLDALARAVASARTAEPDGLCDHLLATLTAGDHDEDDTAVLAVRLGV